MKLTVKEMKTLFMWSCPNYQNTISRMAMGAALMTDEHVRREVVTLRIRLIEEYTDDSYPAFYEKLCCEMKDYYARCSAAKRSINNVRKITIIPLYRA
jgi:Tfp pilus assembly major pilin PilA